jgi:hypothetical protein
MYWLWTLLFLVLQKMAWRCASKMEEIEKKEQVKKKNRIEDLLSKENLSDKEQKELSSLLGDEEVIEVR